MILPYHLPLQRCDTRTREVSEELHSSQQGKGTHPLSYREVSDTYIQSSFTRVQTDMDFLILRHEFPVLVLDVVQGKDLHDFLLHSCEEANKLPESPTFFFCSN